jgi:hypothetical protein
MMAKVGNRVHKHYLLDQAKITLVKKILGAKTETEAIERALDMVIESAEKGQLRRIPERSKHQTHRAK